MEPGQVEDFDEELGRPSKTRSSCSRVAATELVADEQTRGWERRNQGDA